MLILVVEINRTLSDIGFSSDLRHARAVNAGFAEERGCGRKNGFLACFKSLSLGVAQSAFL